MSTVSSLGDDTRLTLVDYLTDGQSSSFLDTSATAAKTSSYLEEQQKKRATANQAYGGGLNTSLGQAAVQRAMEEMAGSVAGPITFAKISAYREDLETSFTAAVRLDLAALGVSAETPFTLTMSADGAIQVNCDDAVAKEKIQEYLADNKKVCEQFGYIQALANLERARTSGASRAAWMRDAKASLQGQAVEIFNSAARSGMSYAGLLADFGTGSSPASFYAGIDYTI